MGRWVGLDECGTMSLGVWIPDGPVPSEELYSYLTFTVHTTGIILRYQQQFDYLNPLFRTTFGDSLILLNLVPYSKCSLLKTRDTTNSATSLIIGCSLKIPILQLNVTPNIVVRWLVLMLRF